MGATLSTVAGTAGTTSTTVVFTASSTLGSAISMIQVTNTSSNNVTVSVRVSPSGTLYYLASALTIPPNTSLGVLSGTLNLQNGGTVVIFSNTASSIDYVVSALNYS